MTTRHITEYVLGAVDDVPPGEGREYVVEGRRIAVFRPRGGDVVALDARCPHAGGPLADGMVGMDGVVCPLHARRFSFADGSSDHDGCAVMVHRVTVDDGMLVLTPGW